MRLKPLEWAAFRNGSGWLTVTPIGACYAIRHYQGPPHDGFCTVSYNGNSIQGQVFATDDSAKEFCARHHKKIVMACFEFNTNEVRNE